MNDQANNPNKTASQPPQSPTSPPGGSGPVGPVVSPKRRRRWPLILVAALLAIVLLVLALPSLLCTGPGVSFIESKIDSATGDQVRIGSLSLGWFTPTRIEGLNVSAKQGTMLAQGVNIHTGLSLLGLLQNWRNPGTINISIAQLTFKQQTPTAAAPAPASASVPVAATTQSTIKTSPTNTLTLPLITNGHLKLTIGKFEWQAVGSPAVNAANTKLDLAIDTTGVSLPLHFSTTVRVGGKKPAAVAADGSFQLFQQGRLLPAKQMVVALDASVKSLDMQSLNPLLAQAGVKLQFESGIFNAHIALKAQPNETGSLRAKLSIDNVSPRGELLRGDKPAFRHTTLALAATWSHHQFVILPSQLTSDAAMLKITGKGSITAVEAALHGQAVASPGASLELQGQADLHQLCSQMPHLMGIPPSTKVSGGSVSLIATAALEPAAAASARDSLPPVTISTRLEVKHLDWKDTVYNLGRKADLTLKATINTLGKPATISLDSVIDNSNGPPSQLTINGSANIFQGRQLLSVNQMLAKAHLSMKASALDLELANSLLARMGVRFQAHGVLSGTLNANLQSAQTGEATAEFTVASAAVAGVMFKGDSPELGNVTISLDVAKSVNALDIRRLTVKSQPLMIAVHGQTTLPAIEALGAANHSLTQGTLYAAITCHLPELTAAFSRTLGLDQSHISIQKGEIQLGAALSGTPGQSAATVTVITSTVHGQRLGQDFAIDPISISAGAQCHGKPWELTQLAIRQSTDQGSQGTPGSIAIASITVKPQAADANAYMLTVDADLQQVLVEAQQFVNMTQRTLAGQLHLTLLAKNVLSSLPGYQLTLQVKHPAFSSGPGQLAFNDSIVSLLAAGQLQLKSGKLASIQDTSLEFTSSPITIGAGAFTLNKTATGAVEIPAASVSIARADLALLAHIAAPVVPMLTRYNLAGKLSQSTLAATYTAGNIGISSLHLQIDDLLLASTNPSLGGNAFKEAQWTADLAGDIHTSPSFSATFTNLTMATQDKAFGITATGPLEAGLGPKQTLSLNCHRLSLQAQLHLLKPLLVTLGKLAPTAQLSGQLASSIRGAATDNVLTIQTNTSVTQYQLLMPGAAAKLPPTDIAVSLNGTVNLQAKTFTALADNTISETAIDGQGSDRVLINKGSIAAWGAGGSEDINGSIEYDLARLNILLQPFLPQGLAMSGKHTMPLHITGTLSHDVGLRQLRGLVIAPTALAFDKISVDGLNLTNGSIPLAESAGILTVGPAKIPANNGYINLNEQIDFNQPIALLEQTGPVQISDNINVNGALGGSLLRFLPLTWGVSKDQAGLMQVSGLLNLQLQKLSLPLQQAALKKDGTLQGTVSMTHLTTQSPLFGMIGSAIKPLTMLQGGNMRVADSGIRPTNFKLVQGRIDYQHLKMVLTSFGLDLSGWVALDNTLHMDVAITGAGLSVPIPLAIDGTTSQPKLKLKLSAKPLKQIGNTVKQLPNLLNNIFGH
ncbi:MAG: hypothetical protein HKL96_04400 [Phycisphaerales bacterium]|nr:hypothetical protein [Phycisphaerales bacterium]